MKNLLFFSVLTFGIITHSSCTREQCDDGAPVELGTIFVFDPELDSIPANFAGHYVIRNNVLYNQISQFAFTLDPILIGIDTNHQTGQTIVTSPATPILRVTKKHHDTVYYEFWKYDYRHSFQLLCDRF